MNTPYGRGAFRSMAGGIPVGDMRHPFPATHRPIGGGRDPTDGRPCPHRGTCRPIGGALYSDHAPPLADRAQPRSGGALPLFRVLTGAFRLVADANRSLVPPFPIAGEPFQG